VTVLLYQVVLESKVIHKFTDRTPAGVAT